MEIIYKKDAVNCTAVPPLILLFELKGFSFFLFRYMQFYTRDKKMSNNFWYFLKSSDEDILFSPNHYYLGLGLSKSNIFWVKPRACLFVYFWFYSLFFPLRVTGSPHPYTLFQGVGLRGNGAEDDLTPYQEHSTQIWYFL